MERSARGEDISGIGMGTLRRDTPGKVEVRPHVEEGEHEAEEEGFEEVARPPMPISNLSTPSKSPSTESSSLCQASEKTRFLAIIFVNALN